MPALFARNNAHTSLGLVLVEEDGVSSRAYVADETKTEALLGQELRVTIGRLSIENDY